MTEHSLKSIIVATIIVAAVNALAALSLSSAQIRALLPVDMLPGLISAVLVLPFVVQSTFLIVQLLPGGRGIVRLPLGLSSDGWLLALVLSTLPSAFASDIAPFATEGFHYAGRGQQFSLIFGVLLTLGRVLQNRWAHEDAKKASQVVR